MFGGCKNNNGMHLQRERFHMKAGEPKMHTGQTVNKVLTQGPYGQMATEKEGTWEDMKKIKKPAIE